MVHIVEPKYTMPVKAIKNCGVRKYFDFLLRFLVSKILFDVPNECLNGVWLPCCRIFKEYDSYILLIPTPVWNILTDYIVVYVYTKRSFLLLFLLTTSTRRAQGRAWLPFVYLCKRNLERLIYCICIYTLIYTFAFCKQVE